MSSFGKNVKKIRTIKKLSQQAFADLFGLKRATLGAYEEGRSEPKIDTIIKVANYFSISIGDMLTKDITVNQLLSFNEGITTDVNQVMKNTLKKVPLVAELNKDLFIQNFPITKNYNDLPTINLPIKEQKGLLAFVVEDLMMVYKEEGLYPGDVVFGIEKSLEEIQNEEVVIALLNKKIHVRRLYKSGQNYSLMADHVNIEPIEFTLASELLLWQVTSVLLNRYPNFVSGLEGRIDGIDEKLKQMNKS